MDEEILEALHENPFHHQEERIASLLDENETQQDFIYGNHVTSSEFDENLQHTCQYFDHPEYENYFKQKEEILEDNCYNPQVKEEIYSSCHSLHQPTSNEENFEKKILDNKMGMLVESYEELPLEIPMVHVEAIPSETVQEYLKFLFLPNQNYDTSSEFDKMLQQTGQSFDHQEYENHFTQ